MFINTRQVITGRSVVMISDKLVYKMGLVSAAIREYESMVVLFVLGVISYPPIELDLDTLKADGIAILVTTRVPGCDIESYLERYADATTPKLRGIIITNMLKCLFHMHFYGVHTDLSFNNMLVDPVTGEVNIIDTSDFEIQSYATQNYQASSNGIHDSGIPLRYASLEWLKNYNTGLLSEMECVCYLIWAIAYPTTYKKVHENVGDFNRSLILKFKKDLVKNPRVPVTVRNSIASMRARVTESGDRIKNYYPTFELYASLFIGITNDMNIVIPHVATKYSYDLPESLHPILWYRSYEYLGLMPEEKTLTKHDLIKIGWRTLDTWVTYMQEGGETINTDFRRYGSKVRSSKYKKLSIIRGVLESHNASLSEGVGQNPVNPHPSEETGYKSPTKPKLSGVKVQCGGINRNGSQCRRFLLNGLYCYQHR